MPRAFEPETVSTAALNMFPTVTCGPGGVAVTLAEPDTPPAEPVIVMTPATVPAVTVVDARPWASVMALVGFTDAEPEATLNVTATPGITFPWESFTWKTIGCGKAARV